MRVSGFLDLIKKVLIENPASNRAIPNDIYQVWDSFSYWTLLSENRSEADTYYLYDLFEAHELMDRDQILDLGYNWIEKIYEIGNAELGRMISKRKKGVLSTFLRTESLEVTFRCVHEGANYFQYHLSDIRAFRRRVINENETNELIAEIAYPNSPNHVYNIGLVKTILWLQGFGLALNHCSPSRQARAFLFEDVDRQRGRIPTVGWDEYWPWLKRIKDKAADIGVTARDINSAIWFYKTPQSLIARFQAGLKWRFTPKTILAFLEYKQWSLPDISQRMVDIDEIDDLASEIRGFMERIL